MAKYSMPVFPTCRKQRQKDYLDYIMSFYLKIKQAQLKHCNYFTGVKMFSALTKLDHFGFLNSLILVINNQQICEKMSSIISHREIHITTKRYCLIKVGMAIINPSHPQINC